MFNRTFSEHMLKNMMLERVETHFAIDNVAEAMWPHNFVVDASDNHYLVFFVKTTINRFHNY